MLAPWIEQTEGAKFWLRVMTEPKARRVGAILIAVVDGLRGAGAQDPFHHECHREPAQWRAREHPQQGRLLQ